jgi:hypothetical protein
MEHLVNLVLTNLICALMLAMRCVYSSICLQISKFPTLTCEACFKKDTTITHVLGYKSSGKTWQANCRTIVRCIMLLSLGRCCFVLLNPTSGTSYIPIVLQHQQRAYNLAWLPSGYPHKHSSNNNQVFYS